MEKTTNTFLNILKIVGIILIIFFALNIVTATTDFIQKLFKVPIANVDANEGININYNGGLTASEIDNQKNNPNCPQKDDMYDGLNIIELDNIVCFYKEIEQKDGTIIYPNILFVKTDNGLVYNGATNMEAVYTMYVFGFSNFTVKQNYIEQPKLYYGSNLRWYTDAPSNIVLFDSGDCKFVKFDGVPLITGLIKSLDSNSIMSATCDYINKEIFNKYFLKFCNDNIEIIMDNTDKKSAYADLNGFYDFVYRSAISHDYGKDDKGKALTKGLCTVDVSKLTVYPIPDTEIKNYPMSDGNFFKVFNTQLYLNVKYEKIEKECPIKVEEKNLDEPVKKKDEAIITTSTVNINFTPKKDTIDQKTIQTIAKENPVTISFYKDGNFIKKIVATDSTFTHTNCKTTIGLENGKYTYTIDSAQILFNSYSGSVTITNSSSMNFEYDYKNGYVLATIGIEPASSDVDLSSLDLANNPIKIVLNSQNGDTIQFVFDNNSKIGLQTQLLKVGKYTLTILSEKAIFSTLSTEIEVTPQSRVFVYKFVLKHNSSDLNFSVNVAGTSGKTGTLKIYAVKETTQILQNKLKQQKYLVDLIIFDKDGKTVAEFNHSHNDAVSYCSSTFQANNLIANEKYYLQLTYRNSDSTIIYTGATIGFTYQLETAYTFTYTCTVAD